MARKVRFYEYTTKDYGKGYFIAKNEKFAAIKAIKKVGSSNLAFYNNKPMISYYSKDTKENLKKKYGHKYFGSNFNW